MLQQINAGVTYQISSRQFWQQREQTLKNVFFLFLKDVYTSFFI